MCKRIKLLSEHLVNQIAAGEVIERPASIVKECLENSIDAKAKNIQVYLEHGGTHLIRIRDDGVGIIKDDLLLAIAAHATNKIRTQVDLQAIASLGFRGEALASIAAIARLSICSRAQSAQEAWKLTADKTIQLAAHPQGTTIEAKEIFYNIPARRKFLRSSRTEFNQVETTFKSLALADFTVGFTLQHNQRNIYKLSSANNLLEKQQRIAQLLNKKFVEQAFSVDCKAVGLHLYGWVGSATFERNQSDWQFFYVNGRCVRDRLINHAIRQAFQEQLYPGKHPSYVLYLQLDLEDLDVNVHPTKHEIRFHNSKLIHDFIFRNLYSILNPDLCVDNPLAAMKLNKGVAEVKPQTAIAAKNIMVKQKSATYQVNTNADLITNLNTKSLCLGKVITQLQQSYIVAENNDGLVLVNLKKAYFYLSYFKLQQSLFGKKLIIRPLLLPKKVQLNERQIDYLEQNKIILAQWGIVFDQIEPLAILIKQLAIIFTRVNVENLVQAICKQALPLADLQEYEQWIKLLSMQTTTFDESELSIDNMNQLLRELEKIPGNEWRSAITTLSVAQIEKIS